MILDPRLPWAVAVFLGRPANGQFFPRLKVVHPVESSRSESTLRLSALVNT